MNPSEWLRALRECFGPVPDSYLVVDVETTGLSHTKDLVLQAGWCEVENRRVIDNDGVMLNWFDDAPRLVDPVWLKQRLESTRAEMASHGNSYPWTESLLRQGDRPLSVLADLLVRLRSHALPAVVTHNGWMFDAPMIENHFRRFLGTSFDFPAKRMWDTGALEKAVQLDIRPRPGDSHCDFARRVMARRARVKWALANHCVPKYDLARRHGLDVNQAHNAVFDTRVTHHLIEVFREMMEEAERSDQPCQPGYVSAAPTCVSTTSP